MWIFRNRDFKKQLAICAALLFISTAASWQYFGTGTACAVFLCGFLWGSLHFIWEGRRYRDMRKLSEQIDEILHGRETMELAHYREGDLEILRDEIQKVTVRLSEQAELLQKDKLALADALADISHQIRTPLTALNLLLERLKSPELEAGQRRILVREAGQMLERIEWLVTALLKMSKLDAGAIVLQRQQIEMASFLEEAMRPFEIPMEVHQKTYRVTGAKQAVFAGDYEWTLEAVRNVLKNGIEHTPDGGSLLIECEENPLYTELKITDSGKGIPQKDLPHLFERFYRGENAGKDSFGIGLALSRMILSQENAVIKAGNAKSGGGQFLIRFYKSDNIVI